MTKYIASFALLLFSTNLLFSQNLVQNPGFETHHVQKSLVGEYTAQHLGLENWTSQGWSVTLCDASFKRSKNDEMYRDCKNIPIYEGKTALKMVFSHCFAPVDHLSQGCASYLTTTLTQNLQIGHFYEISCWLYIPTVGNEDADTLADRHIGFKFMKNAIIKKNGAMFYFPTAFAPRIQRDKWTLVKWTVRPLCEMDNLMFGVFKENAWKIKDSEKWRAIPPNTVGYDAWANNFRCDPLARLDYYIDAVSVVEISSVNTSINASINTPEIIPIYAECYDPETNTVQDLAALPSIKCFFETNESEITAEDKLQLDNLALKMKKDKQTTLEINGNTDNQGSNHAELSQKRAEAVANYLINQHKIAAFRLLVSAKGAATAVAANDTKEGRAANRRVEIFQSSLTIAQCAYRKTVEYSQQQKTDSAFVFFQIWQRTAEKPSLILAYFDPRLAFLQKDKRRWNDFLQKTKQVYQAKFVAFVNVAFQLDSLYCADQKYRALRDDLEQLSGKRNDTDTLPDDFLSVSDTEKYAEDAPRYLFLQKIMAQHGFPKRRQVGNRPARAAFYIIQHQSDTDVLAQYLPILEQYAKDGEAEWTNYAMLYDRIQTHRKQPQRYGTQFSKKTLQLYPIESAKTLNENRAAIGLSALPRGIIDAAMLEY